jgi:hypothetical protein
MAGPTFSNVPGSITVEAVGPAGSQVYYRAPSASDEVDGPALVTCASLGIRVPARHDGRAMQRHGRARELRHRVVLRDGSRHDEAVARDPL